MNERTKGISLDRSTRVIAVASGKGGVGKSTLTANLAAAFDRLGQRVGVLDADVYGHSIPHMLGVHQRPVVVDRMIVPPVRDELKLMSIGFFLDENEPVMWRGPMLHRALEQFLSDVHWGELDTLLVDMPPGTGDVSISLGQLLPRAEVVVVTTPQPAAQQVAVRAAQMARTTNMRLLGAVENMSSLVGSGEEIFGSGGARPRRRARRATAREDPARPAPARERGPRRAARLGRAGCRGVGRDPSTRRGDRRHVARRGSESSSRSPSSAPRASTLQPEDVVPRLARSGSTSVARPSSPSTSSRRTARSGVTASPGSSGWRRTWIPKPTGALVVDEGYERWDGNGAVGYLTLAAVCDAQIASPPERARIVVASHCFPTGMLGHYTRRLAEAGLVAALTATSPARLGHPEGGPPLAGTNPLSIAIPSSDGEPVVADVSMGAVTYGDVIAGLAEPDQLVPFGGEQAHKAFALALGLQLLVDALAGEGTAPSCSSPARGRPVPSCAAARGVRLPGDTKP